MTREKIINFCEKAIRLSYYALIYFLPISIALCEIFSGAIIFLFLLRRGLIFNRDLDNFAKKESSFLNVIKKAAMLFPKIFKPVDNYLNTPVSLFILVCALSLFESRFVPLTLSGFFFKVLEWTYLYFVFVEFIKTRKQLQIFIIIFLISITLISINGLVQKFIGHDFMFGKPFFAQRISSSFRHSNDFGGYLVLVCPFLLSFFLHYCFSQKKSKDNEYAFRIFSRGTIFTKAILFTILILAIACLGWTLSRGAWIGFFIALLFFGWQKKRYFFINLFVIVIFFIAFSSQLHQIRHSSIVSDDVNENKAEKLERLYRENGKNQQSSQLSEFSNFVKGFSGSGRETYWMEAIAVIKKSPIFGSGVNTYSRVAPFYKISWGGYPHNCYLQMTAEIGLVGIFTFLWIIVLLIRNSVKNLKSMKDDELSSILLGLLAGLIGFWVHSFFDTNFYSVQLGNFMWVMMGAIMATQKIYLEEKSH